MICVHDSKTPHPNPRTRMPVALACMALLLTGCASVGHTRPGAVTAMTPAGFRVHNSATGQTIPFSALVAEASRADVVFLGEQHDDPETHFAEFALLDGIGHQRPKVVLSLEMFERDVQPVIDAYLDGRMSEADFLAKSRPWPRYATDYRPLVMLARTRGWPVVASNVPRSIASAVSRAGLSALDTLPPSARVNVAREISCPHDRYFERFAEEMKGHGGVAPVSATDTAPSASVMTQRFYEAQCIKDETMAESVAAALGRAGEGAIVVHFDGAFHSDFGLGTVARTKRRVPNAKLVVISAIAVPEPASATVAEFAARGNFILFTRSPK